MTWTEKVVVDQVDHTAVGAWDLDTYETITTAGDTTRVKNLYLRGSYGLDRPTTSNGDYGVLFIAILLFPDTVSTPDPDNIADGLAVDRQLKGGRFVVAQGQNNPVLFTYSYRAINVRPGFKLYLATQIVSENTGDVTHRVVLAGNYWRNDD